MNIACFCLCCFSWNFFFSLFISFYFFIHFMNFPLDQRFHHMHAVGFCIHERNGKCIRFNASQSFKVRFVSLSNILLIHGAFSSSKRAAEALMVVVLAGVTIIIHSCFKMLNSQNETIKLFLYFQFFAFIWLKEREEREKNTPFNGLKFNGKWYSWHATK